MIELLAPAPGAVFRDRYVDLPFDLSEALFLATATSQGTMICSTIVSGIDNSWTVIVPAVVSVLLFLCNMGLLLATWKTAKAATTTADTARQMAVLAHRPFIYATEWKASLTVIDDPRDITHNARQPDVLWVRGRVVEGRNLPVTIHKFRTAISSMGGPQDWKDHIDVQNTRLLHGEHGFLYVDRKIQSQIAQLRHYPQSENQVIGTVALEVVISVEGQGRERWLGRVIIIFDGYDTVRGKYELTALGTPLCIEEPA